MLNIAEKFKQKLTGAKNKVKAAANKTTDEAQESVTSSTYAAKAGTNQQTRRFEEGGPGTEVGRKDDPLTEYKEKEPMTPAKIKQHEPTAVKREMTEHIVESGKEVPNAEAAQERARRSGMAKGTAGSAETGTEDEQGAAGTNQ